MNAPERKKVAERQQELYLLAGEYAKEQNKKKSNALEKEVDPRALGGPRPRAAGRARGAGGAKGKSSMALDFFLLWLKSTPTP